jgi:hypothetical protein
MALGTCRITKKAHLPAARGSRRPTDNIILLAGVAGQLQPVVSEHLPREANLYGHPAR